LTAALTDIRTDHEPPDPARVAVDVLGNHVVGTVVLGHLQAERVGEHLGADAAAERFLLARAVHGALANRTGLDPVGIARDDLVAAEPRIALAPFWPSIP
jgi:hypothetical protein